MVWEDIGAGSDSSPRLAATRLTAGFMCAPEIGPSIVIRTNSMAAVAASVAASFHEGYGMAIAEAIATKEAAIATADALVAKLKPRVEALKIGPATDKDAEMGPIVSKAQRDKIVGYIDSGVEQGAELVVDGRGFTLQGHEAGWFIGPTFFDHVKPHFRSYREEIFGPVLQMVRADGFEEALRLPSEHQYGNGVAIFTRNGHAAREFAHRVDVGMVGINVPIPVPVAYHTFGGWKRSGFGDIDQHGPEGVRFWTKSKKVTQRWPDGSATGENAFVIPTMG